MSLKIRRYNANESDFTKSGRTIATLDIPASVGFTDLTTSKVVLDMNMEVKNNDRTADILLPATFGLKSEMVGAQAVIRNSKVTSMDYGFMNEQRNSNVISANMDWYLKSRAAEDCGSLLGHSTNQNYGKSARSKLPDNPFFDYRRPSSTKLLETDSAVTRRAEIPISWRHIDEFGNVAQFPNIAVGNLHYQLEFENQFDVVSPADLPAQQIEPCDNIQLAGGATDWGTSTYPLVLTKTVANHWKPPVIGQQITVWYNASTGGVGSETRRIAEVSTVAGKYHIVLDLEIADNANDLINNIFVSYYTAGCNDPLPCDNVTPVGNNIGTATAPLVLLSYFSDDSKQAHDECPLYVGAPVSVVASDVINNAVRLHESTVASLEIDGRDLKVILTSAFVIGNTDPQTQVFIGYRYSFNNLKFQCDWRVNEVYGELHEIQLLPSEKESARKALSNLKIPFVSLYLKQRNMPQTTDHTEVVQADPNCLGLAVLSPQNLTLLSGFDNCNRYRFAINGKDQTNRDIVVGNEKDVGRQLHNYLVKRFFGNMGMKLLKYDCNTRNYAAHDNKNTHSMFPLVTPLVPEPLTIQLTLTAETPMASKNLFFVFAHAKQLVISNGRAMVM